MTRFPLEGHGCVATTEFNRCISRAVSISFQVRFSGQITLDYGVQRDPEAYIASRISLSETELEGKCGGDDQRSTTDLCFPPALVGAYCCGGCPATSQAATGGPGIDVASGTLVGIRVTSWQKWLRSKCALPSFSCLDCQLGVASPAEKARTLGP